MTSNRVLFVLTVLNLAMLTFLLLHQTRTVEASSAPGVLRGTALEIVDGQGKVRAAIHIVPAGPARRADGSAINDGKTYPEAVRLQLIRPDGRPSVKIATTEQGSGLTLSGGIDPTYIVLNAAGGEPSLSLTNGSGQLQVVKPQEK